MGFLQGRKWLVRVVPARENIWPFRSPDSPLKDSLGSLRQRNHPSSESCLARGHEHETVGKVNVLLTDREHLFGPHPRFQDECRYVSQQGIGPRQVFPLLLLE